MSEQNDNRQSPLRGEGTEAYKPETAKKEGWIRRGGLIAFAAVLGVVLAGWYLFVDQWVESRIEKTGTAIVGAKVELDSVDVGLFPAGLTLNRLQVTDPKEPMTNAVEVGRIAMTFDLLEAIGRKWIINEATIDRVQFGTPRKSSGAVPGRKGTVFEKAFLKEKLTDTAEWLQLPSAAEFDPKRILEKEDLETMRLVEQVKADLQQWERNWEERLKALPNKETFEQYRRRAEKLGNTQGPVGALQAAGEVVELQKQIKTDLNKLRDAKDSLEGTIEEARRKIEQAKQAPQRDLARLKEKYGLSAAGITNWSRLFLGPKVAGWVATGLAWRARLEPAFEYARRMKADKENEPEVVKPVRGSGVNYRFPLKDPLPQFLLRTAKVGLILPVGDITGTLDDVTTEPVVLGRPTRFEFKGEKLDRADLVALSGSIDRTKPEKPKDQVRGRAKAIVLKGVELSGGNFPVTLTEGRADLDVNATVTDGMLDAKLLGSLYSATLDPGFADSENRILRVIADTIRGVNRFSARASFEGSLEDPEISVSSDDLDALVRQAVGRLVEQETRQLVAKLRGAIGEKVDSPLASLGNELVDLRQIREQLLERSNLGQNVLKDAAPGGTKLKGLPF